MDRLAFTAAAAITEQQVARQQLVHELANVSTVGFKRSYDMALGALKADGPGFVTRYAPQAVAKDLIVLQGGAVMATGNKLDLAMNHNTVLGVTAADGTLAFTRRGDLRINPQGVLETGSGHLVRGADGPLTVPAGSTITINPDGTVYARDNAQPGAAAPRQVGRLMLRDASTTPLSRRMDGLYTPAGSAPGSDFQSGPQLPSVTPGALEGSNVNAIEAMVKMMDLSRTFEQQVRMIKETKTLDESGATMLRATG